MIKKGKLFRSILTALVLLVVCSTMVLAATYEFIHPIFVTDTGGTARSYVPILTGVAGQDLIDGGFINATATDTNMEIAGVDAKYMVSTTELATVAPSLLSGGRVTYSLKTGYAPVQTEFAIVTGIGGFITVSDAVALEPGDDFEFEIEGYIDTSAGADKDLIIKADALRVYISGATDISASITSQVVYDGDTGVVASLKAIGAGGPDDMAGQRFTNFSASTVTKVSFELLDGGGVANGTAYARVRTVIGDTLLGTLGSLDTALIGGVEAWFDFDTTPVVIPATEDIRFVMEYTGNSFFMVAGDTNDTKIGVFTFHNGGWNDTAGWDCNIKLEYEEELTVSVNGVASGEHNVVVSADTVNFEIDVDSGTYTDSIALGGISVPNNANDFILMDNDVSPYWDYYKQEVSSVLIVHYEPTGMITGTTLPDEQGAAQDGDITWGANADMTITFGGVISFEDTESTAGTAEIGWDVPAADMPAEWFGGGDITTLPFYDAIDGAGIGMPTRTIYVIMAVGLALALGFAVGIGSKEKLFGVLTALIVIWAATASNILPAWFLFIFIIGGVGILYLRRAM